MAAFLVEKAKSVTKIATLIGPPPIPRKDAIPPRRSPTKNTTEIFIILYFGREFFKRTRTKSIVRIIA